MGAWSKSVNYEYNYAGAPTKVGSNLRTGDTTNNVATAFDFRAWGALQKADYANGRRLALGYNQLRSQLTNLKLQKTDNSDVVTNISYDYYNGGGGSGGNNGRIRYITDHLDGNYSVDVGYDDYNRLTSYGSYRSYTYDAWNNLLSVSSSNGVGEAPNYTLTYATNASGAPATNRINNSGYTYDNAGNVTNDGSLAYAYDAAGRLKTAGTNNSCEYDGDGRKVKQVSGGYPLFYLWSSVLGEPVVELDGSGGVYRAYVLSSGGQMIAVQSYDGGFYWLHTDHLGNGRKLTNSSGTVIYRAEFDPHGQMLYEWQSSGQTYLNSRKFTGYERDWATNLNYAKARTYNHNRARFMQPDPLGLAAADLADPQSLNRYSYVGNDPANFVDPSGLLRIIIWGVACVESGGTRTCEYYVQEIIDFGGGFGLLGWGYGGSGQGGDVKPISPIPLKDIVDEAKQALKDPNGDCAKLFNKGNGSSKLGELDKANKIKLGNAKVTTSNGQTMEMKTHNGFAGLYQGGQITISQYSSYYTGTYQGKDSKGNEVTKGMYEKGSRFYGYTPTQALAAILIHEVAHATGDFPPESGANVISESIINTNTVLTACFPKSNK